MKSKRMDIERHRLSSKPEVYLAGPLFSVAERSFNAYLKQLLCSHVDVYLPQEDGSLMPDLLKQGISTRQAMRMVFKNDLNAIDRSDLLIAVLDGRAPDEGAAFELGYAYAKGKRCIGLQTDFRRLSTFGNNPMLAGSLETTFLTVEELEQWVKNVFCRDHLAQKGSESRPLA